MRSSVRWLAMLVLALTLGAPATAHAGRAYFVFDIPPFPEQFVIKLNRPDQIAQARRILAGLEPEAVHVMGTIVKRKTRWNAAWSFHLAPRSIEFFSFAIEVCDSSIAFVEEHLDEVGGELLPGNVWCPWGSRLVAEIPRP